MMCHCAVNSAQGGWAHVSSTHASVARVSSGKHDAASGYPLLALRTYMRRANAVSERASSRQNLSETSGRSESAIAHVLHQWLLSRFSKNSRTTSGPCLYACISDDQAAGSVQKLLENSRIFAGSRRRLAPAGLATILTVTISPRASSTRCTRRTPTRPSCPPRTTQTHAPLNTPRRSPSRRAGTRPPRCSSPPSLGTR